MKKIGVNESVKLKAGRKEFTVTGENIDDILVSALEGGSTYWCYSVVVVGKYLGEWASEQISRGGTLKVYDGEESRILTLDGFIEGLKAAVREFPEILDEDGEVDPCEVDGYIADYIFQTGTYGKVIYC